MKDRRALSLLAILHISGETRFHPSGSHVQVTRKRHKRKYYIHKRREHMKIIWKRYGDDVADDADEAPDVSRFPPPKRPSRNGVPGLEELMKRGTKKSGLIEGLERCARKKNLHLAILNKKKGDKRAASYCPSSCVAENHEGGYARRIRRFCAR